MRDAAATEHLKRQGAAAERQGVLEMLGGLRRRYEDQRAVFASGGRRLWYGRRIEFLGELMAMIAERDACGTQVVAPVPMSSGDANQARLEKIIGGAPAPNPAAEDACSECGRFKRRRERWVSCSTCRPGELLPICPGCVEMHQAVHSARGDEPPYEVMVEDDEEDGDTDDDPRTNAVTLAMDDFDRRVRDIMADSSVADTVAICAKCQAVLPTGGLDPCPACSGTEIDHMPAAQWAELSTSARHGR